MRSVCIGAPPSTSNFKEKSDKKLSFKVIKNNLLKFRLQKTIYCTAVTDIASEVDLVFCAKIMTSSQDQRDSSRVVGVLQDQEVVAEQQLAEQKTTNVEVPKSSSATPNILFVCYHCKQKKKSNRTTTDSVVRTSKNVDRICKKCRQQPTAAVPGPVSIDKKRRKSSIITFHPQWTHYCFLLVIYMVFSVILYLLTLKQ